MSVSYFPSCQFTALLPDVSARIKAYMASRGAAVMGCCRKDHTRFTGTAVTVCQTCRIIVEENRSDCECVSLWEWLDRDADFPFPDLGGAEMTVQDCYRAKAHDAERAAVRSLLGRMNVRVRELPGTEEERNFDGAWLFQPVRPGNLQLAPKRFGEIAKDVRLMPPEEAGARLREYCKRFATDRVVCYCNACLRGLRTGLPPEKQAFHLAELLFPET